jgi:uncharacterized protein YqeY
MTTIGVDAMKARLRADLLLSMRAGDKLDMRVIRTLLAALDNAEAVAIGDAPPESTEVPRRELAQEEVRAHLREEVESRLRAADDLDGFHRSDRAEALRAEAEVARRYLD